MRLGDEWLDQEQEGAGGGVMEVSGSLGSGVWALADVMGVLEREAVREVPQGEGESVSEEMEGEGGRDLWSEKEGVGYTFVHPGRAGVELSERLFERESYYGHIVYRGC